MAIACKCDRCGTFFELPSNRKNYTIKIEYSATSRMAGYNVPDNNAIITDLCDHCYQNLKKWLKIYNIKGDDQNSGKTVSQVLESMSDESKNMVDMIDNWSDLKNRNMEDD